MKPRLTLLLLAAFVAVTFSVRPDTNQHAFIGTTDSPADTPPLNIHIVPHSHDDLGWLKTITEYYKGEDANPYSESVKKILDSVIPVLHEDPNKKFIYVEVGFFKMWWNDQNDETKNIVRELVKNAQLEFINGGYAMNDEADVYYEDSIEQMTLGHQFLLQNFNVTPEVGWHIDPFGHASAQAAMFAQMGFKSFFVARIDYQDKEKRLDEKAMEMVWIPETSQGNENAILAHVNYHHYSNPTSFCFDVLACHDTNIDEYNVATRANDFIHWFRDMSKHYKTNELMHTAGDDFNYMNARQDYQSYDTLFKYIAENSNELKVNVLYSTPAQYTKAIYPLNIEYPVKTDDFFPYADKANAYWTGYFTSRPSMKALTRQEGRFLQASKRLATQLLWEKSSNYLQSNFNDVNQALDALEDALAVAQHHDAVTGTEKQRVAEDYKLRFAIGEEAVQKKLLFPALAELIQKDLNLNDIQLNSCHLNVSATLCDVTYQNLQSNISVLLAVYNSGPERSSSIQVKVPNPNVQAFRADGTSLPTDVICANSADTTDCDLFFSDDFKSYDTAYFYLLLSPTSNEVAAQNITFDQDYNINPTQTISLNKDLKTFAVKFCKDATPEDCYKTNFALMYNYYPSFQESDGTGQKSGAYIFRPEGAKVAYAQPTLGKIYKGKNLLQIHIDSESIKTNMRIYNDLTKGVELQSFIEPISVDDSKGKEIVMLIEIPSINNTDTFYTDSMGMELQKRVVNFRPTWKLGVTEPVSGNYYPVQSTLRIKDESSGESFSILPDRAQGGASLKSGQVELMIHRRILVDDQRGLGEALNELDTDGQGLRQLVTHILLFNKPGYIETSHRQIQTNIDTPNLVLLAAAPGQVFSGTKTSLSTISTFNLLDKNIKVMTRPISANKFLFRFQNMGETENKAVPTQVFKSTALGQGEVVETSLSANQPKSEMINKKFNWNGLNLNDPNLANKDYLTSDSFNLRPLEIRTFVVTFGAPETLTETASLFYQNLLGGMS